MAPSLLDHCRGCPQHELAPGAILIEEGERSGRLFILAAGTLEVYRGDVAFATATEPGAVFGEMSVLLDLPHTASVRALTPAKVYVIDQARISSPPIPMPLCRSRRCWRDGCSTRAPIWST